MEQIYASMLKSLHDGDFDNEYLRKNLIAFCSDGASVMLDRNSGVGTRLKNDYPNILFLFLFCFICHIYPLFTRKRIVSLYFGREVRTRLGVAFFEVYGPPVFHIKAEASR